MTDQLHRPAEVPARRGTLVLIVQAFMRAQARRVASGEALRAILQGRDVRFGDGSVIDADRMLKDIGAGLVAGPVPLLAREYQRALDHEQALQADLAAALEQETLWPWLSAERGISVVLAARLLARVHFEQARRPSSVWRFCGLDTVPGSVWQCIRCGTVVEVPEGQSEPLHRTPDGAPCERQVTDRESERTVRLAAPTFRASGGGPQFDRDAKVTCYLIGVSFLRTRSPRDATYRAAKGRLATLHPEWPPRRHHLGALRVMVKEFLRDAWRVANYGSVQSTAS